MYQPEFRCFYGPFFAAEKTKNPHPKVRKKFENKEKTGTLRFPFFLV
jgi:hypothetical protein